MAKKTYTPCADAALAKVGGPVGAAKITGTNRTVPYKWLAPVEKGGTGGAVPVHHQETLLNSGLGVTPEDFWKISGDSHE